MAFSEQQMEQLDKLLLKWVGPDSSLNKQVNHNAEAIKVNQSKIQELEARLIKLEQKHAELQKRVFQQPRADKEVVLTGYNKSHRDLRKALTQVMRKIDKDLKDREVVKCQQFGQGSFKRISIICASHHVRNRFIDACILNPGAEQAKNFSKGKTQDERNKAKQKYEVILKCRQANRDETDRQNLFHYPSRSKEGNWTIVRARTNDTKVKEQFEAYEADREKHGY